MNSLLIANNIKKIHQLIQQATLAHQRPSDAVKLLAVSKTRSVETIRTAYQAGQHCFGESYAQEALAKIAALADLNIEWHFIGPIQSNKTRVIAENFAWVHSVDRLSIAQRLSRQRPQQRPPLNVLLQVNIGQEASKSGVSLNELSTLANAVTHLPHLKLRGLMAIPPATPDTKQQHHAFHTLYTAQQNLIQQGLPLDSLSMGMSNDFQAAIAAGSTMVRIGTALFGSR